MRKLINRILIKLGLREPPRMWKCQILIPESYEDETMEKFDTIGWKFYNDTGRMNNKDFVVRGEIVDE